MPNGFSNIEPAWQDVVGGRYFGSTDHMNQSIDGAFTKRDERLRN
jgi:hypothetical protein